MSILPNKRPVIKRESAEKIARYFLGDEWKDYPVIEVAVRQKKINFYDDELAVMAGEAFQTFNWNAEPSAYIIKGVEKAILKKGVHFYKLSYHHIWNSKKRYVALRPATPDESLPVWRTDKKTGKLYSDKGIAINQHFGGSNSTWSEGCQTTHMSQYDEFINMFGKVFDYKVPKGIIAKPDDRLMKGIGKIPYILVDQADFNYIMKLDEKEFDSAEDLKYQMTQFHSVPKTPEVKPSVEPAANAAEVVKAFEAEVAEGAEQEQPEAAEASKKGITIDEDLLKFFPDEKAVNNALRKLAELMPKG